MQETTTREEILKAIQELAAELGHPPSISELVKMRPITKASIYRKFGNYKNVLTLCGLERTGPGYQTQIGELFQD